MGEWHEHVYEEDEDMDMAEIITDALMTKHIPPELLVRLALALEKAERKHPVFAEGPYQGIGRITEELGEAIQCINHGEPMERLEEEAMDVLVTAWRFVRGDWKTQEDARHDS